MKHLIICTEYPPAPIAAGGIGTYARHIARLLADAGETVHVITVLWPGAPNVREEFCDGRLIVHRVSVDEILDVDWNRGRESIANDELQSLARSDFPEQRFAWQAGLLAEYLVESEDIELIEAQEFQAPLYYFQMRRALGLGPAKKPPCIVHCHSPTELIYRFNDWNTRQPYARIARQMEAFSIRSADVRLCPSNYMARQVEHHYGLPANSITVIPLPVGETPVLERTIDTWRNGSICYVGRLEPRKGVIEWVDAAVSVADDYPSATFEFIGADLPYVPGMSVQQHLDSRIPERMKSRFVFRGELSRTDLMQSLANARIATVPSRWENFPNTCVEAMGTGLPVVASRNGGMIEMVEDEKSGWIAPVQHPRGLESALRRALATPSLDVATMGREAASAIRELCNNGVIVKRHLAFRTKAVKSGANTIALAPDLRSNAVAGTKRQGRHDKAQGNVVAIVGVTENIGFVENCLQQICEQGIQRQDIIVAIDDKFHRQSEAHSDPVALGEYRVLHLNAHNLAELWNAGARLATSGNSPPRAMLFMTEQDHLLPGCIKTLADVLRDRPDVGIVSAWTSDDGRAIPRLSPAFPYQLVNNSITAPLLIRTPVFEDAGLLDPSLGDNFALWNLVNVSMAKNWAAVVYPRILSKHLFARTTRFEAAHRRLYSDMLGNVAEMATAHALALIDLLDTNTPRVATPVEHTSEESERPRILRPRDVLSLPFRQQLSVARKALRNPDAAARFLLWHTKVAINKFTGKTG